MISVVFKRCMHSFAAGLSVAFAVWLLPPAPAGAAHGDLSFQSCIAALEVPPCTVNPRASQLFSVPIAVSPDGKSVYTATGVSGGALSHFTRAANGTLAFESCLSSTFTDCTEVVPSMRFDQPASIAVSPDGRSIYATDADFDSVSHFIRTAQLGRPDYGGCVSSFDPAVDCELLGADPLDRAVGLAVDPAGRSIYVASAEADSLSRLNLLAPGGQIEFQECLSDTAEDGCMALGADPLEEAVAVTVSPDGKSIYVGGSESLAWFERDGLGTVRYRGCLGQAEGVGECATVVPSPAMESLSDVAVSPDGASLYAVSVEDAAILAFSRAADGSLAYQGCFASDDDQGCVGLPGAPLDGAVNVEVSPDGRSVYALAVESDSIVHFERSAGGALSFRSCAASFELPVSGCAVLPEGVMEVPVGLATSPDGASVYVTGVNSHTVVAFSRSQVEDPPPPPPPPPGPGQLRARCSGKRATIVGTPRADTLRGSPRSDVIAGLGGADEIRGRGGKDLICGGRGRDTILGGGGADRCLGGPGADEIGCEHGRAKRRV